MSARPQATAAGASARPQVGFPQLCAIALDRWQQDRPADYFDWSESIKSRCARLGFAYGATDITRAIAAVQRAHRLVFPQQATPAPAVAPSPSPLSLAEASRFLAGIRDRYFARRSA